MELAPDIARRSEARLGLVLGGKWTLDRVLGIGGMATVYAATHRNKKRAAIKMLHPEVSIDASICQRFLREGYVANTVEHPGTVTVLDDDVAEDGAAYLVMELLDGETLEARRERKGGALGPAEVLSLMGHVLDVLAAAHGKGIIHRDLKPENLFLTRDGRLKVLDFGIARVRELSAGSGAASGTKAGSLLGTPAYMAPEQARGRSELIDERTDLWAVGATMLTLLTGRSVHEAGTLQEQLIYAATQHAPKLRELVPHAPDRLAEVVDRALSFEKNDRWANAREMQVALRAALEEQMPNGPVSLLIGSSRRPGTESEVTIAAPSLVDEASISAAIQARTGSGTLATPPALSTSVPSQPPVKRSAVVAGAIAIVAVLGAVLFFARPTTSTAVPPPVSAGKDTPQPRAPDAPPVASADPHDVTPVTPADPPVTSGKTLRPPPGTRGVGAPSAKPGVKPLDPPPQPPQPPATGNPFDRRF